MKKYLQHPAVQAILLLLFVFAATSAILYTIPTDILLLAWQQSNLLAALGYTTGAVSTVAIWGTSVYHLVTAIINGINDFINPEVIQEDE